MQEIPDYIIKYRNIGSVLGPEIAATSSIYHKNAESAVKCSTLLHLPV
jgi:hypothetical protein